MVSFEERVTQIREHGVFNKKKYYFKIGSHQSFYLDLSLVNET